MSAAGLENVFADVSALHYRPWQLYNSLMLVQEYGVWHKVLFGTDFPLITPAKWLGAFADLPLKLDNGGVLERGVLVLDKPAQSFVFTDIEGSTRLAHDLGTDRWAEVLAQHARAVRAAAAEVARTGQHRVELMPAQRAGAPVAAAVPMLDWAK